MATTGPNITITRFIGIRHEEISVYIQVKYIINFHQTRIICKKFNHHLHAFSVLIDNQWAVVPREIERDLWMAVRLQPPATMFQLQMHTYTRRHLTVDTDCFFVYHRMVLIENLMKLTESDSTATSNNEIASRFFRITEEFDSVRRKKYVTIASSVASNDIEQLLHISSSLNEYVRKC